MDCLKLKNIALLPLACISLATGLANASECSTGTSFPVKGKIVNNLQPPGAISTLGSMKIKVGTMAKMNCGLLGQPAASTTPPLEGGIAFTHTISCDDEVPVNHPLFGEITSHSQLTLDTQGQLFDIIPCNGMDGSAGVSASFIEVSRPQSFMGGSSGRGLFTGVTEGEITIEGTINCAGAVDMKFEGQICLIN